MEATTQTTTPTNDKPTFNDIISYMREHAGGDLPHDAALTLGYIFTRDWGTMAPAWDYLKTHFKDKLGVSLSFRGQQPEHGSLQSPELFILLRNRAGRRPQGWLWHRLVPLRVVDHPVLGKRAPAKVAYCAARLLAEEIGCPFSIDSIYTGASAGAWRSPSHREAAASSEFNLLFEGVFRNRRLQPEQGVKAMRLAWLQPDGSMELGAQGLATSPRLFRVNLGSLNLWTAIVHEGREWVQLCHGVTYRQALASCMWWLKPKNPTLSEQIGGWRLGDRIKLYEPTVEERANKRKRAIEKVTSEGQSAHAWPWAANVPCRVQSIMLNVSSTPEGHFYTLHVNNNRFTFSGMVLVPETPFDAAMRVLSAKGILNVNPNERYRVEPGGSHWRDWLRMRGIRVETIEQDERRRRYVDVHE